MTNNNFQAVWLSKYRDVLQGKIVEYENLIHNYASIEEVGNELSSSDLYQASTGWLGTRGDDDTKEKLHSVILQNKQWLTTICESLVKLAQEEIKDLSEVLGKVTVEEITARNQVRKILSNYQSKRRQDEKQLNRILENIIDLGKEEYGILQKTMQVSANEFIKFFASLLKSLEDETTTKGSLFINYYDTIVNLDRYHSELENLSISDFDNFLAKFNRPEDDSQLAKCFVENFRGNKDLINEVSQWADKTNLKSSGTDKGYTSLEEDDQKKLDGVMQGHLELLFKNCVTTKSGKGKNRFEDVQKQIKKIVKAPEDMNKLKDSFNKIMVELQDAIKKQNKNFKKGSGGFNSIEIVVKDGTTMKVSDFNKKYMGDEDNKSNLNFVINELQNIIDNKKTFKDFLEMNSSLFRENSSKDDEDDSEKLKDVELMTFNDNLRNFYSQLNAFIDSDGSKTEVYDENIIKGFLDLLFGDIPKEEDDKLVSKRFKKVLNTFELDNNSNKNSIEESLRQAKLLYNDLGNVSVLRVLLEKVKNIFASKFG